MRMDCGRGLILAGLMAGLLVPGGAAAPAPGPAAPGPAAPGLDPPRLAVEPAGRVDLGELGPLEHAEQRYRFRNLSGRPIALRVYDLSPGVGVAGPALQGPIAPGTSAGLVLHVDPEGWVGVQKRNVRLGTDDPRQGDYYLPVRMVVRPDLSVDGARRSLGEVALEARPEVSFRFVRETREPLSLRVSGPLPGYLECALVPAGPSCRLVCRFHPERVPPGMNMGLERIPVESNAPLQPHFDLYLDWRLRRPVEAQPSRLVFLAPSPEVLGLRLWARGGEAFRILRAELEGAGFRLEAVPRAAAPEQVMKVRRISAKPARAMLVLYFSGSPEPLRVPLAYLPGQAPQLD